MRVVLDTNVIISGLYSKRGASYQLLQAAISGELTFVISPLVAFEYEGKVYKKIQQGFLKVSREDCGSILDALFAAAEIVLAAGSNKAGFIGFIRRQNSGMRYFRELYTYCLF